MTELAQRLKERYFREEHPYRTLEREVERHLRGDHVLLDAGCGRGAPVLLKFRGKARRLIGVDVVDFDDVSGVELLKTDLADVPLEPASVDLVMSRSVMEHVIEPQAVYREIFRLLKPGGQFIFLTPNLWDYASLIAKLVPNRLHPAIVARTEGRAEQDVFPVAYRTNTRRSVVKWAQQAGFRVQSFEYLGQYPSYFMFNGFLFLLATGYEKLITRVRPLNFLRGWIFATLQKPAAAG
jgi:SAM-dependent methyltransferase